MGRAATLKVDILADARGASRGVDEADRKFSKLGGTLGKVAKVGAAGLAVGLGLAAGAAVKLAAGAAEDEKAAARLAQTLKNTTGATKGQVAATEDWITKQGKALGVADDDLRPALGRLAAATGDVGKAQKLASLAMDVSAGTGQSLESVSKALVRAQNGNVSSLGKLGIATKDAAGKTITMHEATRRLAKMNEGQASRAANTAAGKFGRLKLRLSEMGESIGSKLLPVGNKLIGWALKMAPTVEQLAGQLGRKLGPAFRAVGDFIRTKVVPAGQEFGRWFIEKIAPGIKRAVTPVIEGAKRAFDKVKKALDDNRPALEKVGNAARTMGEFFANKVLPIVGKVAGLLLGRFGDSVSFAIGLIGDLIDGVSRLVGWIGDLIDKLRNIDWPSPPKWVGDLAGKVFSAELVTVGPQLVGPGVSYAPGTGLSTAGLTTAATSASWSSVRRSSAGVAAGSMTVDARTFVTVEGALDADAVARQLEQLLRRRQLRLGGLAA